MLHQFGKCSGPAELSVRHTAFYKEAVENHQREFNEMVALHPKVLGSAADRPEPVQGQGFVAQIA